MTPEAFAEFADLLPDSILLLREDGRIEAANRASRELVGLPPPELVGHPLASLVVDPSDRVARYLHHCSGSREPLPGALTYARGGDPIQCRCDAVLFRPAEGEHPALILLHSRPRSEVSTRFRALNETIDSLWREIAERQRVEQALRASQELTRRILASTPDCIAVLDREGRLLDVNPPGRDALELGDPAESANPLWVDLWIPEDRTAAAAAVEAARRGATGRLVGRSTHSRQGRRWWDVLVTPILDPEGRAERLVAVARDVTERRQGEEQLRQSAKMEAIGRLAGGLAHDFNNHLHVQSGLLTFVLREPGLVPEVRRDLLEVQSVADHMASLTRQLLAFSRQQVLRMEILDLNDIVTETRPMLQRLIGSSIEIRVGLGPGPLWIEADRSQLVQVLMNLVINARDAMRQGGTLEIETATRRTSGTEANPLTGSPIRAGEYAILAVSDTGGGIHPEHLPHIFEPFFTTKALGEGTGLGLATVHGIVSQSQGYIRADSEIGRGTRFEILLPRRRSPAEAGPAVAGPGRRGPPRRARVLVVEDEEQLRSILLRTLEGEGYQVLQARNGLEALDCLHSSQGWVEIVVSDIVMPGLGGRPYAERLASEFPGVPVIWISGDGMQGDLPTDRLGSGQPLLQKPIPPEVLLETVRRLLEPKEGP